MWAPSGPGPAGWDRRRVGARLRAALAGLQELQGLRATQQARVRGALGLHQAPGPRGQELRLEAALAALREQLSRLRRQDAGLKTHLDQLDQQISELQLDVSRSPCEALDSDSRPSSGFYELSDAGSCSLSTSCASVCSDRLSPSLGSWLPALQPSKSRSGMGDWRPRSADETTVPAWSPQRTEDSRLLHAAEDTGRLRGMFRPRPVSTGDLERVLPADTGLQSAGTDASSLLCQGIEIPAHALDPKYQRDLVARGGQEVYPYPSPLHAVALQSPLFALPKEAPCFDIYSPPEEPSLVPADQNGTQPEPEPTRELGSAEAYIHRLLRLRGQELPLREVGQEQGGDAAAFPQKSCGQRSDGMGQLEKPACGADWGGMKPSRGAAKDSLRQQGPVSLVGTEALSSPLKEETIPWNPCVRGDNTVGSSPSSQIQQPYTDCAQGPVLSPSRVLGPESPPLAPGPFAYTSSSTNETSPLRLRMGSPQNKAMKVKRRVSEKVPRLGKQLPPQPEKQRGIHAAWSTELDPSSRPQQGGLNRRPTLAREPPGRSCSESTLYPVPLLVPLVVTQRESYPASSQALFPMEAALLSSAARRKQRRWQSTMEISAKSRSVSRPGPNLGPPKSPAKRTGGPRAQSRPSLARQDACARSESDPSEHSAECASLFHSTIAETSEDEEASDHTANRFGDESSSNDSEDCAQSSRRGLAIGSAEAAQGGWAWPPVPLQQFSRPPGGTRPSLPPVPKLCRIKASKALKKKIRRFQPAALKVMTMV